MQNQEQIFDLLFEKDDVTWKSIIYELVRKEEMDPWNINVSLLTQKYIGILKRLKELDFRISGKVLLAASILLKIKSNRLIGKDLTEFDRMMQDEEIEEEIYEEFEPENLVSNEEKPILIPRIPQPRKRKVSIYDLVGALEKALEVKKRRVLQSIPTIDVKIPEKKIDISLAIRNMYAKIKKFFLIGNKKLEFSALIPSEKKEDKVLTFIPLLYLTNQRKIDLIQERHFGEIGIILREKKGIDEELAV